MGDTLTPLYLLPDSPLRQDFPHQVLVVVGLPYDHCQLLWLAGFGVSAFLGVDDGLLVGFEADALGQAGRRFCFEFLYGDGAALALYVQFF
jgi:hypothetical protein